MEFADQSAAVLVINDRVRLPRDELVYRFMRSGGPGGQHVNKTETGVELVFDLAGSPSLTEAERALAAQRLGTHLDQQGVVHLVSRTTRSQLRNREEVTARFVELLSRALVVPKQRRRTRPSRAARAQRVADKRQTGQVKRRRQAPRGDE